METKNDPGENYRKRPSTGSGVGLRGETLNTDSLCEGIVGAFSGFYNSRAYSPYRCTENINQLISAVERCPSFEGSKAKVLILIRSPEHDLAVNEASLITAKDRDLGHGAYSFHVVLDYNGFILDPAFGKEPVILPADLYFQEMYVSTQKEGPYFTQYVNEWAEDQIEKFRFRSSGELEANLFVHALSTKDYQEQYLPKLRTQRGDDMYQFVLEQMEQSGSLLKSYLPTLSSEAS